jgi:2-aminobenzoate-CoA ligase
MSYTSHKDTFARDSLPPREQWPELIFDIPEVQYPERVNCGAELVDVWVARGRADRVAIIDPEHGKTTYAQVLAYANQIANFYLNDLKLVPGNRILLRGSNSLPMACCWLAAMKAGLVVVTTMPMLRAKELTEVIEKSQAQAAICDSALKDELLAAQTQCPSLKQIVCYHDATPAGLFARFSQQPAAFENVDTAADDVCMVAFTSGTTGKPKGTMHFHRDMLAICDCFPRSVVGMTSDDVCIGTPPLAFTFGLGGILAFPLRYGGTSVLLERASPASLLQAIDDYQATITWTAPTFYRQMAPLAQNYKLTSLKKCVSAGEALPVSTRTMWREATGIEMIDGIGATEMLHIFISAAGADVRPGATGKAVRGYKACVLDEAGNILPAGEVGRLAVKGPTGCRYMSDERQLKYAQNGWNLTGDTYKMDEDGYFWYQARTDDMIISAGYNIAGPEVEDALLKHPAVAECAVVGAPDEERGMVVKAVVVLKAGAQASDALTKDIQDFVKNTIAPYKYPRVIEYREALPRTETGKLQRFRLRQK